MPYRDLNNERIYYALYRGELISSRPIVLIHGAGESHLAWPAGLRRLLDSTVYAIDLPGHGKSTGSGRSSVAEYVAWVAAFLDAIQAKCAILIGHSMGGAIAQLFGLTHPDRAAGLVLVGTGAKLRVAPRILELTQNDLPAAADLISQYQWGPHVPEQIIRLGKQQLLANRNAVIHGDYRACDAFDVIDRLSAIKAPTLIISGTADQLTPPKYAAFMAEKIPNARLVSVPDAGHMVMLEAEAVVTREVEAFVREWKK
ncbi:MAG TPA: alpha/beta hydrolase [Anaerolineae bacterium]